MNEQKNLPAEEERFESAALNALHQAADRLRKSFRFSISLRTSLFYGASFFQSFFFLAFLLSVAFAVLRAPVYAQKLSLCLSGEAVAGVSTSFWEGSSLPGITFYGGWGAAFHSASPYVSLQFLSEVPGGFERYLFDLTEDLRFLLILLAVLLAGIVLESVSIILRGRKNSQRLLSPLNHIVATAQSLSEKNLSARIHLEGAQSELEDLARVLNEMLDRLENAYNRQKQFVSDASHELRTPLAVLQGYAGLLQRWGKDSPEVFEEAITAISAETKSMNALVENLLFLARHDRKTLSLSFTPFNAGEMLRESIRDTEMLAARHQIITGEIAGCVLTADRPSIKQAIRIFVDNALKFTPEGGYITLSSREIHERLEITVSDDGPGIAKEDLEKIFDRFYRTESARNGKISGHGLGLSIARMIAASHGGKIRVRSALGKGTSFTLDLPLEPPR